MKNILLAEDDDSTRFFLQTSLKKEGYAVTACADGMEAMDALKSAQKPFDLLLTDIVMPGMDGIELSTRAKTIFPELKIVFITGFAAMATQDGVAEQSVVVSKPFHLSQLVTEINGIFKA